jgi:acetyltransferase-like isoleucine patch superfamily enzyme
MSDNAAPRPRPGAPRVSVIVIGRNEGERLSRCLGSVLAADWDGAPPELIYVDSRSSDDSMARARAMGASAWVLDDPAPCAAKARNLGLAQACGEFVLYLDGDTELHPAFPGHALRALADGQLCAAWGHRRETAPGQSLYTRVLDLDWIYPCGRTPYFGGDVMVRRLALQEVGGYDPTLKAGEEPELCARLRAAGWQIEHLDVPMTGHDLAVRSLGAYARRAYRSGIAYAEVAERMRRRGDPMWQHEAMRDRRHGLFILAALLLSPALPFALLAWPALGLLLAGLLTLVLTRTAWRCRWKAPDRPALLLAYAAHVYLQKLPALFGQWQWQRAARGRSEIGLVEYKDAAAAQRPQRGKRLVVALLGPLARLWRAGVQNRLQRAWAMARLQDALGHPVDPSNVLMGVVEVRGSGQVSLGRGALLYPGVVLETQGAGRIEIGDDVVLSAGVHIVAFERVSLGAGTLVGEYTSLRDANHRASTEAMRHSGHDAAPIEIGRNVWIGRGACVLAGVRLGDHAIVAANAVVTRDVEPATLVAGVPARPLRRHPGHSDGAVSTVTPHPEPGLPVPQAS